jgi:sec-independent protein translocase protein TatA
VAQERGLIGCPARPLAAGRRTAYYPVNPSISPEFAMGAFSIWHLLIVLVVVILLFGAGRLPTLMGDMAKGVKAFKKGLNDDDVAEAKDKDPVKHA